VHGTASPTPQSCRRTSTKYQVTAAASQRLERRPRCYVSISWPRYFLPTRERERISWSLYLLQTRESERERISLLLPSFRLKRESHRVRRRFQSTSNIQPTRSLGSADIRLYSKRKRTYIYTFPYVHTNICCRTSS
jgi:hypothetical protein